MDQQNFEFNDPSDKSRLLRTMGGIQTRLDAMESILQTLLTQVNTLTTTMNDLKQRIG